MTAPRRTFPFFVSTFAISWLLQIPALLALAGIVAGPPERFMAPAALGAFGPLFAALLVARFESNGPGVRGLFAEFRTWRVGAGWYLLSLLLPGALLVVASRSLPLVVVAHVGVHLNNSHIPLPENFTPVILHTLAYAALAFVLVLADRKTFRGSRAPALA